MTSKLIAVKVKFKVEVKLKFKVVLMSKLFKLNYIGLKWRQL